MKKPSLKEVMKIDLEQLHQRTKGRSKEFFNGQPGTEHYRLLAWISTQYTGATLVEMGTLDGCGALALSYNPDNLVRTYDIREHGDRADFPVNVQPGLVNMGKIDPSYMPQILKASLIFYDTYHDGVLEADFLEKLLQAGWKGTVVWDDISLNLPMRKFWHDVMAMNYTTKNVRSENWTDIGHWSGTGITFIK